MPVPIAFVSRYDRKQAETWLTSLSQAMPDETILAFHDMDEATRQKAEIAIVANPDPEDVARLPHLKWIHGVWAGVERLVAELPKDAPPIVRLIDPWLTHAMAEGVLTWCLYLQRDLPAYLEQQSQKVWNPLPYRPSFEWTVGILGLGELGTASAKLLQAAGFNVAGWARSTKTIDNVECYSGQDGLSCVLAKSDIVVCLLPLTAETTGLFNHERFDMMKKNASLINFARGPLVDSAALLSALETGQLHHAVLDVFNKEPLPPTCPYWLHPKITVLPHVAALTNPKSASKIVAKNIAHWRKNGTLPQIVSRDIGY